MNLPGYQISKWTAIESDHSWLPPSSSGKKRILSVPPPHTSTPLVPVPAPGAVPLVTLSPRSVTPDTENQYNAWPTSGSEFC